MTNENETDYLSLIRENFTSRNIKNADIVSFCKVKKPIKEFAELNQNFITDSDSPAIDSNIAWIPLAVSLYPGVLSSMTANQAGFWAIMKCNEQRWEPSVENIESCLTNLEMDM